MNSLGGLPLPRNLEYADGILEILDQTLLPHEERVIQARDLDSVLEAIASLRVRGAPAIGIAAAYGLCAALRDFAAREPAASLPALRAEAMRCREALARCRPMAVNLAGAMRRMAAGETRWTEAHPDTAGAALIAALEAEAASLHEEEREVCEKIAAAGLELLPESARIMTHCNAGPLATGGIGTALGVILRGFEAGRDFTVLAGETRPLLQGARLTAWELGRAGVPCRIIPDGAGAGLILAGELDAVIVGADRVAANGDTANKVGTLPLALAAARAEIPFYVAAPLSSFDPACPQGGAIPIEERDGGEVLHLAGTLTAPAGALARNPAFDVTPGDLVTAFLTERGVLRPPYAFQSLSS